MGMDERLILDIECFKRLFVCWVKWMVVICGLNNRFGSGDDHDLNPNASFTSSFKPFLTSYKVSEVTAVAVILPLLK